MVQINKTENHAEVMLDDVYIQLSFNQKGDSPIVLNKKEYNLEETLSYSTSKQYILDAFHFDFNQDSVEDYFITSAPYLATGIAANIQRIAALISVDGKLEWRLYEISSFLGGKELFIDADTDGQYEFACINMKREGRSTFYYAANFFEFKNGMFAKKVISTPIPIAKVTNKVQLLEDPSEELKEDLSTEGPKVY